MASILAISETNGKNVFHPKLFFHPQFVFTQKKIFSEKKRKEAKEAFSLIDTSTKLKSDVFHIQLQYALQNGSWSMLIHSQNTDCGDLIHLNHNEAETKVKL